MRKGILVIFARNKKIANDCFNYIKNKLIINIDREMTFKRTLIVNNYEIHIVEDIKGYPRGYRPEIMYILNESDRNVTNEKYIDAWKDAKIKTYLYSNRIEPVRYIKNFTDIDLGEIFNDEYAFENKCDINKINEWYKLINRGECNEK
jgi:hypothetical protein